MTVALLLAGYGVFVVLALLGFRAVARANERRTVAADAEGLDPGSSQVPPRLLGLSQVGLAAPLRTRTSESPLFLELAMPMTLKQRQDFDLAYRETAALQPGGLIVSSRA